MLLYPHDALACWTEGGFFFFNVCVCACVSACVQKVWLCGCQACVMRRCVSVLVYMPCVGLCTTPPPLPHIPVMLDTPPPPLPLHQHIKHYLQNNTIMWDKASFWVSIKERAGKQQKLACTTWPYGKGGGGGDEVVMRWCGRGFVSQGER